MCRSGSTKVRQPRCTAPSSQGRHTRTVIGDDFGQLQECCEPPRNPGLRRRPVGQSLDFRPAVGPKCRQLRQRNRPSRKHSTQARCRYAPAKEVPIPKRPNWHATLLVSRGCGSRHSTIESPHREHGCAFGVRLRQLPCVRTIHAGDAKEGQTSVSSRDAGTCTRRKGAVTTVERA